MPDRNAWVCLGWWRGRGRGGAGPPSAAVRPLAERGQERAGPGWRRPSRAIRAGSSKKPRLDPKTSSQPPQPGRQPRSAGARGTQAGRAHSGRTSRPQPDHFRPARAHYGRAGLLRLGGPPPGPRSFERLRRRRPGGTGTNPRPAPSSTAKQGRLHGDRPTTTIRTGEHLHRGYRPYLLAVQASPGLDPSWRASCPWKGLLCQASARGRVAVARERMRPRRGRPSWYLYEVWSLLGPGPAGRPRCLRAAEIAALMRYLTPVEQRRLAAGLPPSAPRS